MFSTTKKGHSSRIKTVSVSGPAGLDGLKSSSCWEEAEEVVAWM